MKYLTIFMFFVLSSCLLAQENAAKDTVTLNEIVVTGTKLSTARNQIPFTISQITQKSIAQSGESALLSIIGEYTPGVFITQRGVTGYGISTGSAGQINIRGIGGNPTTEVLVLVNGNPQFAGIFGHPLPDTYLSSDVDKVEIIRGPASILYGSNAMGGVINIITKKETQDGFHLNNRTMYGSFNTSKVMLSSGFRKDKFGITASFNYDKTDGDRPSSDFELKNGYMKADYTINNHFTAGADFSVSKIIASDPGAQSANTPGYKSDILRTNSNISINDEFENISGAFHMFYNYGENEVTDGFFSIDRNYGLGVYQSLKAFGGNVITAGFDYKNYGGSAINKLAMKGKGMGFGDFDVNEKAGYVLVQQSFDDRIVFNVGYRIEDHSVYGVEHIPSAGIAYYVSESTTLKTSVSKGFRSPTIRELYLFTPANRELKPERVINYELGLMHKLFSNRLGVELTVFKADGDNLIQTITTGSLPRNVNTGEFSNWGVEFSAKFNQNSSLNYILNYTFIHMDKPVLSTPEHSLYASVNYLFDNFRINLSVQNITNLNSQVSPTVVKENYTLVNSMVSYKVFQNFDVFVKAKNILDKKYQINYDYPMPGITLFSGFNFSL
jgi:outer membrane cobalamin receptor